MRRTHPAFHNIQPTIETDELRRMHPMASHRSWEVSGWGTVKSGRFGKLRPISQHAATLAPAIPKLLAMLKNTHEPRLKCWNHWNSGCTIRDYMRETRLCEKGSGVAARRRGLRSPGAAFGRAATKPSGD